MSGDDYQTLWLPNSEVRERATVPSTTVAALAAVRGYLIPRYVEVMDDGRRVAELRENDLQRVADGYACGECLAYFDQRFVNCPSCVWEIHPSTDIVDYHPSHWEPSESRTSEEIIRSTRM